MTAIAIAFLLFTSASASAFGLHQTRRLGGRVMEEGEGVAKSNIPSESEASEQVVTQRRLSGRPKCIAKCGSCKPCQPVLVIIQPGTTVRSGPDYYPEAWRCKCGNKIYMP